MFPRFPRYNLSKRVMGVGRCGEHAGLHHARERVKGNGDEPPDEDRRDAAHQAIVDILDDAEDASSQRAVGEQASCADDLRGSDSIYSVFTLKIRTL